MIIWIDLNGDGQFSEDEMVGSGSNNNSKSIKTTISIPELEYTGISTMRIFLSAKAMSDPCEIPSNNYGEYEDYCVVLDTIETCLSNELVINANIYTDKLTFFWADDDTAYKYLFTLENENTEENLNLYFENVNSITYFGLDTCEKYTFGISKYCNSFNYSETIYYSTSTLCGNSNSEPDYSPFKIFPNPFSNIINIQYQNTNNYNLMIYDNFGIKVHTEENINDSCSIQLEKLKSGIYYIAIQSGTEIFVHKIIKI